jgi:hypothetical protein
MEKESQAEHGGIERKMAVTQLLQIKYLLAGILGLIVVGRDRDWEVNLGTIALTFWLVYSVETFYAWIPGSASRLPRFIVAEKPPPRRAIKECGKCSRTWSQRKERFEPTIPKLVRS